MIPTNCHVDKDDVLSIIIAMMRDDYDEWWMRLKIPLILTKVFVKLFIWILFIHSYFLDVGATYRTVGQSGVLFFLSSTWMIDILKSGI